MKKVYLILITGLIFLLGWMPANSQSYCTTGLYTTGCTSGDDIYSFIFGDFQKLATTCPTGGYANFTATDTIVVYQGLTYSFSVNSSYPSSQYFGIWMDLNGDGDFDDAGEFLWGSTVATSASFQFMSGTTTIPFTANLGTTRLRVRGKWGAPALTAANSCTGFTWGEAQDYTIKVLPAPPCIPPSLSGVSNLTNSSADVNFAGGPDLVAYNIQWGPTGFTPGTGSTSLAVSSPFTITGLTQNTTYDVYIEGICLDTLSPLVGPVTFTTLPDNLLIFTYSGGDIPTIEENPVNPNNITACSDTMTVNLPNGLWVTSVDIYYNMTAQSGSSMNQQRSRVWSPTSNTGEPDYFAGTGFVGTFNYARTGLNYWNMMFGEVEFIMDAKRTTSSFAAGPGCHTLNNFVVNNTWEMHITLDTMPDCVFPFNIQVTTVDTSALITWMDNPTAAAFNWEYGPAGYTQGTGSLGSGITVADSVILNGLSPETVYDFYVQSICGPDGNSVWIGPVSFETKCNFLPAGTYTLGNATADFVDFAALVEYLLCGGLGGPVIIDVIANSGPFEEQATFPVFAGASSTNTLTINGNDNLLQYTPTVNDSRHTLALNGASYMTFNDLHVLSTGSTLYGYAAHLYNNANFNTFNNCIFETSITATGVNFSAFVVSTSLISPTTAGQAAHNLTITNSEFIGGYYGVALNGPTVAPFSQDYHIENNIIRDFYLYGLYMRGLENAVIDRNEIFRDELTNITTFYGIYAISGLPGAMITNNSIHTPYGNITAPGAATVYPFYITGAGGTVDNPWYMINNRVYNMNTNGTTYGAYILGVTDHYRMYHNTFSLVNTTSTGTGAIRGAWLSNTATNVEVKNNIFHINNSGTGAKYALYVTTPAGYDIDHNVLSNASTTGTNNIGFAGGDFSTFELWQDAGFDENGAGLNPIFVNELNDLTPQMGAIKGIGADLTAIAPLDFDGVVRPTDPDPGVYQFEVDSCAAPFVVNITPGDTFAVVSWVPNVATALWQIEYGPAGYTVGTGMFATTTETSYTITDLLSETAYDVYIRPDCGANSQWGDAETFSTLCFFLLEGTYTLGNATADFEDFTALVDYFNCGGVAGPVIIEVIPNSGPFEEQVILPFIPGSSEVNTITIMGNNNTLEYLSTNTNERATLKLNGTKHMTFKHLNIVALGSTTAEFGFGVHLMNNADYNTFDSCMIQVTDVSTAFNNYAGIVASNSPSSPTLAGTPASHLTITNCEIIGGYYGLSISGPTTAPWLQNNVITNNVIRDFYFYGIYLRGTANSLIDGNDINRATRQGPITTFTGIHMANGMNNTHVSNNRIHSSLALNTSSTVSQYGLYFASANGTADEPFYVYNNMIYNMRTTGFSGGVYSFGSNHFRLYHNTISLVNDQTTGSGTFYGVYITDAATNTEFKNNIVHMDLAYGGTKYLMYFPSTLNSTISNYNVFNQVSTGGTSYFGYYNFLNVNTFADWQALGLDTNSVNADPFFVNPLNNLIPQSSTVSQIGTDLTDIVPFDIFGVERSETPDPGAIEFEPASCLSPSGLTVSNITYNTAELSWTDNTPAGEMWLIEVGPAGFTPTGVPTDTAYAQPYLITGLSEVTTYDVYITVVCAQNEQSAWAGPVTFTTFPEFAVVAIYDSGQIPTFYQPTPSLANVSICAGEMTVEIPEGFWITTVDVSYSMTALGGAWMSEQRSRLVAPGLGIGENQYFTGTGLGGTFEYNRTGLDMFAMLTGEVTFALDAKRTWGELPTCGTNYNYVNNNTWTLVIALEPIPACPAPTMVNVSNVNETSALISWTEVGTSTSWDIEFGEAGFTPTGVPTYTDVSNPFLVDGLTPETLYDVYLRSDCDTSGLSMWTGPLTFITMPINTFIITYTGGDIPTLWQSPANLGNLSTCAGVISVDIPEGFWVTTVDVEYTMTSHGGAWMGEQRSRLVAWDEGVGEDEYFDGAIIGGGVVDYSRSNLEMFFGLVGEIDFHLDAKRVFGGTDCNTQYVYVNNNTWTLTVKYDTIPPCVDPKNIEFSNITDSEVEISWNQIGDASSWNIEFDTSGFTPTGTGSVTTSTNPFVLTGLTGGITYDIYIQADCDTNGVSVWVGPFSFTTTCTPASIFAVGDEICQGEFGLLLVTSPDPDANFAWYTQPTGGTPFFEGDLFVTEPVSETTTYYVESIVGEEFQTVGKDTIEAGASGTGGGLASYLVFDAFDPFTLQSVDIYPYGTGPGTVTIQLRDLNNVVLESITFPVVGTQSTATPATTIDLGFAIEPGTGYRLGVGGWTGGVTNMYRDNTNLDFPYTIPDLISITGSNLAGFYYFFYNWSIRTGCISERVPVTVDVIPAPEVDLGGNVSLCDGQTLELTGPAGASAYLWTIATSSGTTTASSQNISVTESGTYTLMATNAAGCSASDEATVTIVPALDYDLAVSATEICEGESVTLTASGSGLIISWSGGIENGVAFTPTETSTYILTVTDSVGACTIEESVTITVSEFVTVTANASSTTVCSGSEVTLTGSGATNYDWSGGVENGVPFTISATTTFTVTGSTGSCTGTDEITIIVNPTPTVTINLPFGDTLCIEDGVVSLSGGSPAGGVWSGLGITGTSFDPAIPGLGFTDIIYTFTDANGCSGSTTFEVFADICISTKDLLLTDVSVFPNPFNQYVDIRWLQLPANTAEIRIIDILGRTLSFHKLEDNAVNSGQYRIELEQLAAGSYIIELRSGEATFRQTILKAQ